MYGMTHKSALPDVALYELYDRLKDAGRFHETFYDGEIEDSHHGFRDYARRPDIHLWALIHGGELSGMCWLTHVCHGGTAFASRTVRRGLHAPAAGRTRGVHFGGVARHDARTPPKGRAVGPKGGFRLGGRAAVCGFYGGYGPE